MSRKAYFWSAIDSFGIQAVQFVITIALARMIAPSAFGIFAIALAITNLSQVIVDGGFSIALIRRHRVSKNTLYSVFYTNVLVSFFLFLSIYISSGSIGSFFESTLLSEILKISCFTVLISSLSVIPKVILTKRMDFKSQALASFISSLLGGGIAIVMAIQGYGIWALLCQSITFSIANSIILIKLSGWRLQGKMSLKVIRALLLFSGQLLLSSMLDLIYKSLLPMFIGKQYGMSSVGYYNQSTKLSELPAMVITNVTQKVSYPQLCNAKSTAEKVNIFLTTLKISTIIIFPLMAFVSINSKDLVELVLGHNWGQASDILKVIAISFMLYPVHAINLNLLKVFGKGSDFFRLEIIKKIIALMIILGAIVTKSPIDVFFVLIVFMSIFNVYVNGFYTSKLIGVTWIKQFKVLGPNILYTVFASSISLFLTSRIDNSFYSIITSAIAGLTCLIIMCYIFEGKYYAKFIK
ncbi:lipopolysaccharide biosynthesis protein [Vibrio harveyi]|uniref:lipopolysaccharide biosynthesis protein n=1 Tax=Vibrio harveyi TaxID=669 RepID=UPI00165DBB2C|nr:lipopolysaccharide biosynthesis protein [Vibrio harveyi]